MLLPVLNKARDRSAQTACTGNLRQVSMMILQYADQSDGRAPINEVAKNGSQWYGMNYLNKLEIGGLLNLGIGYHKSKWEAASYYRCNLVRCVKSPVYTNTRVIEENTYHYSTYCINDAIAGNTNNVPGITKYNKLSNIPKPSRWLLMAESSQQTGHYFFNINNFGGFYTPYYPHGNGIGVFSFTDGHIRPISYPQFRQEINKEIFRYE